MKKSLACTSAAAAALIAAAAPADAVEIKMTVSGKAYVLLLENHPGVESLLEQLPITVRFEDYGRTERIAYLPKKLDVSGAPNVSTPATGDIAYYIPWGNLAVFVEPFRRSPGLMPLGRLTPEALEAVKRSGDAEVIFSRKE